MSKANYVTQVINGVTVVKPFNPKFPGEVKPDNTKSKTKDDDKK